MVGTVAVGQRTATQQLPHAFRPPALGAIALDEQIADRPLPADEHQLLAQQLGFKHIAEPLKPRAREIGIAEEGQRLQHPAHSATVWQRPPTQGLGFTSHATDPKWG